MATPMRGKPATGALVDADTVADFGREWAHFRQDREISAELDARFEQMFAQFPWDLLPADAAGFDAGCGTGRWAARVASRVGHLHCVDASNEALDVARKNLADHDNVTFENSPLQVARIEPASMDFGYSIGVLHHVPDTAGALNACTRFLKPGAPFLVYLYYAFDHRPLWFRVGWRATDLARRAIAPMPHAVKVPITTAIAATIYWPMARLARRRERKGKDLGHWPFQYYRDHSFYTMRTDALDRFGTRLEQRFSKSQIQKMMEEAGLEDIRFNEHEPYWCAIGVKADT